MFTLDVSKGQFHRTISFGRVSPQNYQGRPRIPTSKQVDELVAFVCQSQETRRMSSLELSINFPLWDVRPIVIG